MKKSHSNTTQFWSDVWERHFDEYIHYKPLQAFYLYFVLNCIQCLKILEIGAGSFLDTNYLNQWGSGCIGIDFSQKPLI